MYMPMTRTMTRRLKLFLVTILGFSTACSSVKNGPKGRDRQDDGDSTVIVGSPASAEEDAPRVIVMYGVRRPVLDSTRLDLSRPLPEESPSQDDK